ncbi:unnamed protein product, partial [Rotaria sp. Silwood2]
LADINDSLTVTYSSCDPSVNNGQCSTNNLCRCALLTTGEKVCTLQMSCSYATPCDPQDFTVQSMINIET